jgi:CheY-like chemotaxis protein
MCTYSFGVMIVDDNDADVESITRGLLSLAAPPCVVLCHTAGEALEALHTHPELQGTTMPFVILVEANLPLVSGLEFVACMRCDARLSRIPVFVLTGSNSDCEQFTAHDLGVAGCLRKPTAPDESKTFAARIETYVRSGNSANRSPQGVRGRARVACVPRKADGTKLPASQRRSFGTSVGEHSLS